MIESRLSASPPPLALLRLTKDPTILKYIASNQSKILARRRAGNRQEKLKRRGKDCREKPYGAGPKGEEKDDSVWNSSEEESRNESAVAVPSLPQPIKNLLLHPPPSQTPF
jgi:hypothetical protein